MKKISFFTFFLFIFILYSCEYQPSEVYNRKVNRDVPAPQIQVVELNLDADTVFLYSSLEIKFKFQSSNQKITGVNFLIDGVTIGSVYSASGTFTLQTGQLAAGIHDLEIEVYTGSGTGSLAEELGMEAYVASRSWKLVIHDFYNAEITKFIENGLLHIRWNDFKSGNFKEYVIHKGYSGQVIRKSYTSEFVDSSYVGENTSYTVDVITSDDFVFSSSYLYIVSDLPQISYSVEDSNRYMVKWTKSKYYNAVDTFSVYQGTEYDSNCGTHVKSTRDPNDTTCRITTGSFGDLLNFKLKLVPRKINADASLSSYFFESHTYGFLGLAFRYPVAAFPYIFRVNNDEFVYYDCYGVSRYSLSQRRDVETLKYEPTGCSTCNFVLTESSNSGKYLTSFVDCDRDILFTGGTSLNNYSIHKLQNITYGSHTYMAVSDSGTAIIQNADGGLNLYDLSASTPVAYYNRKYPGYYGQGLKISPGGEYFFVLADSLHLVHFNNNRFTETWKQPKSSIKFYEFDPVHSGRVVFWNGSVLSVKNCSDMSVVNEYDLNDEGLLDIDYDNDEMLTCTKGHLLVRSFSGGTLVKDVPVNFDPLNWTEACYLINHTIVYGKGLLYFIYPDSK